MRLMMLIRLSSWVQSVTVLNCPVSPLSSLLLSALRSLLITISVLLLSLLPLLSPLILLCSLCSSRLLFHHILLMNLIVSLLLSPFLSFLPGVGVTGAEFRMAFPSTSMQLLHAILNGTLLLCFNATLSFSCMCQWLCAFLRFGILLPSSSS